MDSNIFQHLQRIRWQRLLLVLVILPALAYLNSCGGGSSTTPSPVISVSCNPSQLTVSQTAQCTASIANLSSTLATFSVSGTGNGTIDANSGLYTAPTAVPTNNVITITAAAQAQTSLTSTTTITLTQPTAITGLTCSNSNGPVSSVASGQSLACTATTTGGASVPSNWTISPAAPVGGSIGATSGMYTAPLIPPPGQTITITATSQAVATQTISTMVTTTLGNAVLQGPYAFSTSGRVVSTNGFFGRAGSFTASCSAGTTGCPQGSIIGGLEDTNQSGIVTKLRSFTGTFSVGPDGRGTMQFCEDITTACTAGAATASFRIVVVSGKLAQIIEFGSLTTSGGEMVLQDQSIFGAGNGSLVGTYSFDFTGVSSGSTFESAVGQFTANGNGNILAGVSGSTPGSIDINPGGTQALSASTYAVNTNGRGTATIGSLNFSFYVVSASRAKFIEIDSSPASVLVGDAYKQQTSLPCVWGSNVLTASNVFETAGSSLGAGIGDVGILTANGTGGFTTVSIDQNNGGSVSSIQSLGGTYTVDPCGRGTIAVSGHSYVFYPISTTNSILQETSSGVVAHGFLVQQVQPTGATFTNSSFHGSYSINLGGVNAPGAAGMREDIVGQLTANGTGNLPSGTLDINNFGTTTPPTGLAQIGTYLTVAANGRTTVLLNPTRNLVLYFVTPNLIYALGTDNTGFAVGTLNDQF